MNIQHLICKCKMIIIRYLILFFILSFVYISAIFGGAVLNYNLIGIFIILFLLIPYTPLIGKLILKNSERVNLFYSSYITLLAVILPTSGSFAFNINYPYFIFDLIGIEYFHYSKNGIFESFVYPIVFMTIIGMIMVANFYKKNI